MSPAEDQLGLFSPGEMPVKEPTSRARPVAAARPDEEHERLARELPPGLYLGTSSWSFPGWAGIVWERPESQTRLARHGLPAYAQHPLLTGVGIDRSYYQPLPAEEYRRYADAVPRDFRFLVKAHEALTVSRWPDRDRYGTRRGLENHRFLDPVYAAEEVVGPFQEGLGETAGPLVFQFAPQDLGTVDRFIDKLYRFLIRLPEGPVYAIELRNREVLTSRYAALLEETGAVHCLNRHPRMPTVAEQARAVGAVSEKTANAETPNDDGGGEAGGEPGGGDAAGGDGQPTLLAADKPLVCRWMLRPGLTYQGGYQRYHPFNRRVDDDAETRGALAELALAASANRQPVYVTANNKAEGCAPLTIFQLSAEIAHRARRPAEAGD